MQAASRVLLALILAIGVLRGDKSASDGRGLKEASLKFISGIKEVISDKRVAITSAVEGLQNMTMGALEAFLPIYAVKVVAGILLARYDYFPSFLIMSSALILAVPLFSFGVKLEQKGVA